MQERRRKFTPEFRDEAVKMVIETSRPRVADEDGVLGKSGGLLRPGVSVSSKYEFIDAEKALYPVVKMCEWMVVSWWCPPPGSMNGAAGRARRRTPAGPSWIGKVFADSDDTYGYRRVHAELTRLG